MLMVCARWRVRASTSARYRGSRTTLSSVMGFTWSPLLRRARQERRSVSYLFLHLVSAWFSQHRNKPVRSRSAEKATAFWFARRTLPRTEVRRELVQSLAEWNKETRHVHHPSSSDDNCDARAVCRRTHRFRTWSLEALWQQRRRVPQSASPGRLACRCHGRLGRDLGAPVLRLVRSQPRRPHDDRLQRVGWRVGSHLHLHASA